MTTAEAPILTRPDDIRDRVALLLEEAHPIYAQLGSTIRRDHGSAVRAVVDATIWAVAESFLEILSAPWLPIQQIGSVPLRLRSLHCPCCFAALWVAEDSPTGAVGAHAIGCPWIIAARALGVA